MLLVFFFIILPLVELLLLIWIGGHIGFWWTLALVIGTGVLGGLLAKWQGARAWRDVLDAWRSGRVPGRELVAGALFLVGAAFLITPGVLTDSVGLLLMVPVLRRAAAGVVMRPFRRHAVVYVARGFGGPRQGAEADGEPGRVTHIRHLEDER